MVKGVKFTAEPPMKIVRKRYQKLIRQVKNGKGRNKLAAIYLDQWVQINFMTSGKNVGGWAPLAAGGRFRKGKLDTQAKVLMDTGRLRLSFHPFHTIKTAGIVSRLPYAEKHHEGQDGLPKRRLLPLHSKVRMPLRKIYEADLKNKFKRYNVRRPM